METITPIESKLHDGTVTTIQKGDQIKLVRVTPDHAQATESKIVAMWRQKLPDGTFRRATEIVINKNKLLTADTNKMSSGTASSGLNLEQALAKKQQD